MIGLPDFPNDEQCLVRNPKEIAQILSELEKNRSVIELTFNHGEDRCFTRIVAVDREQHAVYLDIGIDDVFNQKLVASHHVIFSKNEGVRVGWTSHRVSIENGAIRIALPNSLMRLQRREFFRLPTPITNPITCYIPYQNSQNLAEKTTIELINIDVSLGGIGVAMPDPLHHALVVGAYFETCTIDFPKVGEVHPALCIRSIRQITLRNGAIRHRIGLEFVKQSLHDQQLIHRYVTHLERQALVELKDK